METSKGVLILSPTLLIRTRCVRCRKVNPYEPVGGKEILCIVGGGGTMKSMRNMFLRLSLTGTCTRKRCISQVDRVRYCFVRESFYYRQRQITADVTLHAPTHLRKTCKAELRWIRTVPEHPAFLVHNLNSMRSVAPQASQHSQS